MWQVSTITIINMNEELSQFKKPDKGTYMYRLLLHIYYTKACGGEPEEADKITYRRAYRYTLARINIARWVMGQHVQSVLAGIHHEENKVTG